MAPDPRGRCGEYDTVNDLAGARVLDAALRGSVLKVIPDCGHYYALEPPGAVAAVIARAFSP